MIYNYLGTSALIKVAYGLFAFSEDEYYASSREELDLLDNSILEKLFEYKDKIDFTLDTYALSEKSERVYHLNNMKDVLYFNNSATIKQVNLPPNLSYGNKEDGKYYALENNTAYYWDDNTEGYARLKSKSMGGIKPLNAEQNILINSLIDGGQKDRAIVVLGGYGTGKSFLTAHYALGFPKINYITNNSVVKDSREIGLLPGSLEEKELPFLGGFIDIVGKKKVLEMIEEETIEVIPVAFARGRSLKGITIVNEAQNLSMKHIALLIGRIAKGGVIIFEGDLEQADVSFSALNLLTYQKGIETYQLNYCERGIVAKMANKL